MAERDATIEEAARKATASLLGYKDWDDATDYRLTGIEDMMRERTYRAFHAFGKQLLDHLKDQDHGRA